MTWKLLSSILIFNLIFVDSFLFGQRRSSIVIPKQKFFEKFAVPEWLAESEAERQDEVLVTVRFINTVDGKDVVTKVPMGSNLLAIGDAAGVKLPRACRTGLCGSCTCDVKDPAAIKTDTNPRDGFATLRACSTKVFPHPDFDEMVVDVHRMQKKKSIISGSSIATVDIPEEYVS